MKVVHDARIKRDDAAGATETVAVADEIAYGYAFGTDTEAEGEATYSGYALGDAGTEEILIRDRDDALPGLRSEAGDAIRIFRIEEILPLGIDVGVMPEGFVGLRANDESPAAIAGLHGGVCGGFHDLSLIERRAGGVIDARGYFECETDGDIAAVLGRWTEDP